MGLPLAARSRRPRRPALLSRPAPSPCRAGSARVAPELGLVDRSAEYIIPIDRAGPAESGRSPTQEELPLSTRVHELAKELGLKSQELLDRIQKWGLDVKASALASLDPAMVERIKQLMKGPARLAAAPASARRSALGDATPSASPESLGDLRHQPSARPPPPAAGPDRLGGRPLPAAAAQPGPVAGRRAATAPAGPGRARAAGHPGVRPAARAGTPRPRARAGGSPPPADGRALRPRAPPLARARRADGAPADAEAARSRATRPTAAATCRRPRPRPAPTTAAPAARAPAQPEHAAAAEAERLHLAGRHPPADRPRAGPDRPPRPREAEPRGPARRGSAARPRASRRAARAGRCRRSRRRCARRPRRAGPRRRAAAAAAAPRARPSGPRSGTRPRNCSR